MRCVVLERRWERGAAAGQKSGGARGGARGGRRGGAEGGAGPGAGRKAGSHWPRPRGASPELRHRLYKNACAGVFGLSRPGSVGLFVLLRFLS